MEKTWNFFERFKKYNIVRRIRDILKGTGVKRRPCISELSIEVIQGTPYDHMHKWLLAWIRNLTALCIGTYPRCLVPSTVLFSKIFLSIESTALCHMEHVVFLPAGVTTVIF
eukprot:gb/GEZJ01009649.1/.p1 GENE.gb/GEZJ01009649.1/~~gb/GEZJ01009649.1/.p1  ORF type:complete len:112 (+),score=7.51 gb/GEZJ01009649.1/:552-887(+)